MSKNLLDNFSTEDLQRELEERFFGQSQDERDDQFERDQLSYEYFVEMNTSTYSSWEPESWEPGFDPGPDAYDED